MRGARRWWWVVVIPLVAALATAVWTLRGEGPWSAVASVGPVVTGTPVQQGAARVDADEYVATFEALATGTPLLEEVAARTGVDLDELERGVSVTRQGDSSALRVRFEAADRGDVEPVLDAVTRLTLERVFQPGVEAAEQAVARATAEVEDADAAVAEFGTRTGVADPGRAYQAQLTHVNTLEVRRAEAAATGQQAEAQQLAAQAAAAREALATYTPLLTEYDAITSARATARERLDRARQRQEVATELVAATAPEQVVSIGRTRQEDGTLLVARSAGVAGAVALVLCMLLASALQAGSRTRAGQPARVPEAAHAARDGE